VQLGVSARPSRWPLSGLANHPSLTGFWLANDGFPPQRLTSTHQLCKRLHLTRLTGNELGELSDVRLHLSTGSDDTLGLDAGVPDAHTPAPTAVSLRGIEKRYGSQRALHPLDLDIRDGEFLCLLGPSGCGKTTTLNIIGGFVAPTAGTVSLNGERIDDLPPHRRGVNTVFQSYALFPHMTVRDNVAFGLKMARVPRAEAAERVKEVLALVGLEEFGERRPGELSGGQQQRVAVARALVNRPVVLLLDEPLGALDLKLRKRLQIELAQIRRELGMTFVYVTHDQDEAMTMGDRIAVLNEGRIEQLGTPEEIYFRPATRFVAGFIGESNLINAREVPRRLACGRADGTLMLRPEALNVADMERASGAPADAIHGTVLQTSFLGNHRRVAVSCEACESPIVVACFGRDAATEAIATDCRVALWWDPMDVVVFDDDPPADPAGNGGVA
jgi:ABC-type Fe3+/spermidine/putrescine transport system ATPase subunit